MHAGMCGGVHMCVRAGARVYRHVCICAEICVHVCVEGGVCVQGQAPLPRGQPRLACERKPNPALGRAALCEPLG